MKSTLAILALASLVTSCRTSIPKWDGKIYAGDSANAGVSRKQSNEVIRCDSPAIDEMLCMTGADFKSFYETYVLGCQKWARGMPRMSIQQAWAILDAAYSRENLANTVRSREAHSVLEYQPQFDLPLDEPTDGTN